MSLTRSEHMRRIRSADTQPEVVLRSLLWRKKLRYRVHKRVLGVRPDIVFLGPRVAIFVDGCFWHGCPEHYASPRTSQSFWSKKLRDNVLRDARQTQSLEGAGYRVLRYLAHDVWNDSEAIAEEIEACIRGAQISDKQYWRILAAEPVSQNEEHQTLLSLNTSAEMERTAPRASNSIRKKH